MVQSLYYNYRIQFFVSENISLYRQIFMRLIFMGSAEPRKFISHENFYVYGITSLFLYFASNLNSHANVVCCTKTIFITLAAT